MKHQLLEIVKNQQISQNFHEFVFSWEGPATPLPGQFINIRVSQNSVPLLRRPFAFSDYDQSTSTASLILQLRGEATRILASLNQGENLDIIGPLGNSFNIDKNIRNHIMVAGGIGLGPMLFLAKSIKNEDVNFQFILGCRSKDFIPNLPQFKDIKSIICTDDGSEGFHGTTVDYLSSLDSNILSSSIIYACGPFAMLKGCHELAEKHKIPCQVSMEQIMACGVGACMGCVVKVKDKKQQFARVCSEGPVFNSRNLLWT